MRLTHRLDALARRLPDDAAGGEESVNRAVFARYRRETEAVLTAVPPLDYDAYNEEFLRLYREMPDFLAQMEAAFIEQMWQEEAEHGAWVTIPGFGMIRERTYARLRSAATGGHDATTRTP